MRFQYIYAPLDRLRSRFKIRNWLGTERIGTQKDLARQLVAGEMFMPRLKIFLNDQLHSIGIVEGKKATIGFESCVTVSGRVEKFSGRMASCF